MVVGLDPDIKNFPKFLLNDFGIKLEDLENKKDLNFLEKVEKALFEFNKIVIDSSVDEIVAIKPQLACYEVYGSFGIRALEKTLE